MNKGSQPNALDRTHQSPSAPSGRSARPAGPSSAPGRAIQRAKPLYPVDPKLEALKRLEARVQTEVGSELFDRYFRTQAEFRVSNNTLEVHVNADFMPEVLSRKFGAELEKVATAEAGPNATVRFVVTRADANGHRRMFDVTPGQAAAANRADAQAPAPRAAPNIASYPSLDDFIVGMSNQLAHAAACRLADAASSAPKHLVFFHGGCGLGKTHLLQGLARRYAETKPGARVRYLTAEAFTNEYIHAVRNSDVQRFRDACRQVDLLCIDDVHFLGVGNKSATQHELLHTFNELCDLGTARVALASDEHPRNIRRLSEALISRFVSGVVAGLETPDARTRAAVAERWAAKHGLPLTSEAAQFLAQRNTGSIRDLIGELTRLEAVARCVPDSIKGEEPITSATLVRLLQLASGVGKAGQRPIRVAFIVSEMCRILNVAESDFKGKGRHKLVVLSRAITVMLARRHTQASFPEIARAMNRPNHSSIITALQRLTGQIDSGAPVEAREYLSGSMADLPLAALVEHISQELLRSHATSGV